MSDLQDEPDPTGNGSSRNTESRTSISVDASSPTGSRKLGQASPTDLPKKKRKVNHGLFDFQLQSIRNPC